MENVSYRIVRKFVNSNRTRVIRRSVSLALAREHCSNPETSSKTCTTKAGKARTRKSGPWFDCFYKND